MQVDDLSRLRRDDQQWPWAVVSRNLGHTSFVTDGWFVGRSDELARFDALLAQMPRGRRRGPIRRADRREHGASSEVRGSRVILVHGLGGTGKTTLLRRFQEMVDGRLPESPVSPGHIRSVWLDFEDQARTRPSLYAGTECPSVITVLDALQHAVVGACGSDSKARERAEVAFAH